jgi:hypothetical protein
MLFFNVNYPENVEAILNSFAIAQLNFIPNPLYWIMKKIPDLQSPRNFYRANFTGLFANSAGSCIFLLLGMLLVYLVGVIFGKSTNFSSALKRFSLIFYKNMTPSLFIRTCTQLYMQLCMCGLLQIFEFRTDTAFLTLSSLCGAFFYFITLLFPFVTLYLTYRKSNTYGSLKRY